MSLRFGPEIVAIPGPSVIPERVLRAMHRPSPNIYKGELVELTNTIFPDLKDIACSSGEVAIYIANGHGAWEAALRNVLNPSEKILVLKTGQFGGGWGQIAESIGIEVEYIDFGMQGVVDASRVSEALAADTTEQIKAVLVVHTDTASSVRNDILGVRRAIDDADHNALLMVDCIASLACDRFEMDSWGVDVMVSGCQKGLMTPAGISFVYFRERGASAREHTEPGYYWDWLPRTNPDAYYNYFGGTAPTHHLYGLREALDMIKEEGLEAVWRRHEILAGSVWSAIDVWGSGGSLHHNVSDSSHRSVAVSSIETGPDEASLIRKWCEREAGVTLGIGLGFGEAGTPEAKSHFRIGHMGHNNVPMTLGVLGSIDCALKSLGIPHGSGALESATELISGSFNE